MQKLSPYWILWCLVNAVLAVIGTLFVVNSSAVAAQVLEGGALFSAILACQPDLEKDLGKRIFWTSIAVMLLLVAGAEALGWVDVLIQWIARGLV